MFNVDKYTIKSVKIINSKSFGVFFHKKTMKHTLLAQKSSYKKATADRQKLTLSVKRFNVVSKYRFLFFYL